MEGCRTHGCRELKVKRERGQAAEPAIPNQCVGTIHPALPATRRRVGHISISLTGTGAPGPGFSDLGGGRPAGRGDLQPTHSKLSQVPKAGPGAPSIGTDSSG